MLLNRKQSALLNRLLARKIGCNPIIQKDHYERGVSDEINVSDISSTTSPSSLITKDKALCRSINRKSISYDLVVTEVYKNISLPILFWLRSNNFQQKFSNKHDRYEALHQSSRQHQQQFFEDKSFGSEFLPNTDLLRVDGNVSKASSSSSSSSSLLSSSVPSAPVYHVLYSAEYSNSIVYIMAIMGIYILLFSLLIYANWTSFNPTPSSNSSGWKRMRRKHLKSRQHSIILEQYPIMEQIVEIADHPDPKRSTFFKGKIKLIIKKICQLFIQSHSERGKTKDRRRHRANNLNEKIPEIPKAAIEDDFKSEFI
ncbi:cyclin-K [Sarcoptes scabiei]|nr:cyclin-K [Sarcoptes scabiei]